MISVKSKYISKLSLLGLSGLLVSSNTFALAEIVHPRDHIAAPVGTTIAVTYLDHASGDDLYVDGNKVANNGDYSATALIQRVVHYTEMFGMVVDPQIIVPYADVGVGILNSDDRGIGDTLFGATFWTINDPKNKEWFGISPFVYAPTGDYDSDKAVNIGANRWSTLLEFGYVKGIGDKTYLDFVGEIEWYGDNDDPSIGGSILEKDPAYRLSSMISHDINSASYVWGRHAIQRGGRSFLMAVL